MTLPIIEVKHISKKYTYGPKQPYLALRDLVMDIGKNVNLSSVLNRKKTSQREFWALKDISFTLGAGEVLGIVGKNGAGKSTLLKILSRITPPTSGHATIRGRVASLLEVGTGFHPELTGKENIFLNGAILGMKRNEIIKKFDQIVEFAQISKFLDTSVKYYSSGMYTRLAFSIAVNLNADILIIDEVLAVGDIEFQKKSFSKMNQVARSGKTILLVTHNMQAIQRMANKVLILKDGKSDGIMSVNDALIQYMKHDKLKNAATFTNKILQPHKSAWIIGAKILNSKNQSTNQLLTVESINIEITWVNSEGVNINPNILLTNESGMNVMISTDTTIDFRGEKKNKKGIYTSKVVIPANLLNQGEYTVSVALDCASPRICYDSHPEALCFILTDPMDERSRARGLFPDPKHDVPLWSSLDWSWKKIS